MGLGFPPREAHALKVSSWLTAHGERHPGLAWRVLELGELSDPLPSCVVQVASPDSAVWREAFDTVARRLQRTPFWLLLVDASAVSAETLASLGPDAAEPSDTLLIDCGRVRARARHGGLGALLHQLEPMVDDAVLRCRELGRKLEGLRTAHAGLVVRRLDLASGEWPDGVTTVYAGWSAPSLSVLREVASLAARAGTPLHVIDDEAQGPELLRRRLGWLPGGLGETVVVRDGVVVAQGDGRALGPVRRALRPPPG